jgi:hypothetical protein
MKKIFFLDEIVVGSDHSEDYASSYRSIYIPAAEKRGMRFAESHNHIVDTALLQVVCEINESILKDETRTQGGSQV